MFLTNPLGIGIRDLLEENTGHQAPQYIAFVGAISIFVILSNLLGVFPFFASPTGNVSVPWLAPSSPFCISTGKASAIMVSADT